MIVPDVGKRTVTVPVRWVDGHWQLLGGGELPTLKDGAIVDLVFPAIYLSDPEDVKRWTEEITVPFLPKATELLIRVNSEKVPDHLVRKTVERTDKPDASRCFVSVILETDLSISLVPGKKGRLNDCSCSIPAIEQAAESVNEAYKKIATMFEPTRRSNSGNIFLLAFLELEGRLIKLDEIRNQLPDCPLELQKRRENEEALRGETSSVETTGQKVLFERDV